MGRRVRAAQRPGPVSSPSVSVPCPGGYRRVARAGKTDDIRTPHLPAPSDVRDGGRGVRDRRKKGTILGRKSWA